MIKELKNIYLAVVDNRVICFDTNLKGFFIRFCELVEGVPLKYDSLYSRFKKADSFNMTINDIVYYLQKIEGNK